MALCIVMALGILSGCGQKTNDTPKNDDNSTALSGSVSTNGSTSMDKVIGALKEQFTADNPGVTVTYDPTGSGAGIEAVKNGSADIGLASRALKDQEKSAGLQETTVALDGIAIIINADSKVADLTVAQIADIFTGKITDWSEVGGDPGAISCIGRESGSGTLPAASSRPWPATPTPSATHLCPPWKASPLSRPSPWAVWPAPKPPSWTAAMKSSVPLCW